MYMEREKSMSKKILTLNGLRMHPINVAIIRIISPKVVYGKITSRTWGFSDAIIADSSSGFRSKFKNLCAGSLKNSMFISYSILINIIK